MASNNDLFFRLGNLVGMGSVGFNDDNPVAQHRPGSISMCVDAYGYPKIFKYVKNKRGSALAKHDYAIKAADVAVTNMTTASTTTQLVSSGFTANAHDGKMVSLQGETPGTAPDGEVSICRTNSTTVIFLEPDYAYSAAPAPAGTADAVLVPNWQAIIGAASTLTVRGLGIVVGADGITDGQFGWTQIEGPCVARSSTVAITVDLAVIPSTTGSVIVDAGGASETWIGSCMATTITNTLRVLVNLKIFTSMGAGTVP